MHAAQVCWKFLKVDQRTSVADAEAAVQNVAAAGFAWDSEPPFCPTLTFTAAAGGRPFTHGASETADTAEAILRALRPLMLPAAAQTGQASARGRGVGGCGAEVPKQMQTPAHAGPGRCSYGAHQTSRTSQTAVRAQHACTHARAPPTTLSCLPCRQCARAAQVGFTDLAVATPEVVRALRHAVGPGCRGLVFGRCALPLGVCDELALQFPDLVRGWRVMALGFALGLEGPGCRGSLQAVARAARRSSLVAWEGPGGPG